MPTRNVPAPAPAGAGNPALRGTTTLNKIKDGLEIAEAAGKVPQQIRGLSRFLPESRKAPRRQAVNPVSRAK